MRHRVRRKKRQRLTLRITACVQWRDIHVGQKVKELIQASLVVLSRGFGQMM
jgi:hypothetical protein